MSDSKQLTSEYIYNTIARPIVGSLATEVVIIGMFFVAFAYMQHVIRDHRYLMRHEFWQRVALLGVVMLFTIYIAAAYEIEFRRLITIRDHIEVTEQAPENSSYWMTADSLQAAKSKLVLMFPVDLLGMAITVAMYATLYASVGEPDANSKPNFSIRREFGYLAILNAIWHLDMVLWWVIFSIYSQVDDFYFHISYHFVYIFLYALPAVFVIRRPVDDDVSRPSVLSEWLWVSWYAALIISVYGYRLWTYADRMMKFQQ